MDTLKRKILIADHSSALLHSILQDPRSSAYEIETVTEGMLCLQKLSSFRPDLVITELMLPKAHGIEILKAARSLDKVGVIISDFHQMRQNYTSAVRLGADCCLEKPFTLDQLFETISLFFQGNLHPLLLPKEKLPDTPPLLHEEDEHSTYIKFWGTRGSNPVAGSEYIQFGGNTPCLEIRDGNDLLIIDAGSGIRGLGQKLSQQDSHEFHILFSHLHWDHLLGFPFFSPIHQSHRTIHIWTPVPFEKTTKELFSEMMTYAYFPVSFDDIQSQLIFHDLRDSQKIRFGNIEIATHYAYHPGPTLCFKITIGDKKIGYVTDNEFLLGCHLPLSQIPLNSELFAPYDSFIHFLSGCDILIHEAQYTHEEYLQHVGWGHSSLDNASILIKKANIKHWIVVHHDPRHTDKMLLEKYELHKKALKDIDHECRVEFAHDGMLLPL